MYPKMGEFLGQQPKAYTRFIVDLITAVDENGNYLIDENTAPDYLSRLKLESPVDPLLGKWLVALIKVSPKFADRIFSLLPHWNAWLTPKQADGLLSWTLNKSNREFYKEENQKIVQQFIEKELPITAASIINLIKNNRHRGIKIFKEIPYITSLFTPEQANAFFSHALNNHDGALINLILEKELPIDKDEYEQWLVTLIETDINVARKIFNEAPLLKTLLSNHLSSLLTNAAKTGDATSIKFIFELKLPLDDSTKSYALTLALCTPPFHWPVVRLFVEHQAEFISSPQNILAIQIIIHALSHGEYELAQMTFKKINMPKRFQLLADLIQYRKILSLKKVVTEFLFETETQELLLKNYNQLILNSSTREISRFLLAHYWPENISSLLLTRALISSVWKLEEIFLDEQDHFLEKAIDKNQTAIVQGLLLLHAAVDLPLPPLSPAEKTFIDQINWQTFNMENLPLSEREFDFLQEKIELPYVDYVDYLFKQLQRPINTQLRYFIDALYPYTQTHEHLILQRLVEELNDETLGQLIPVDDDGKPTTYLGKLIFDLYISDDNPIVDVEELKDLMQATLTEYPPQQGQEQETHIAEDEMPADAGEPQAEQGQEQPLNVAEAPFPEPLAQAAPIQYNFGANPLPPTTINRPVNYG